MSRPVSEGKLLYISSQGLVKDFPCPEKLQLEDLVIMAEKAKSQLIYDVSIEFLLAAFQLAEKVKVSSTRGQQATQKNVKSNLLWQNSYNNAKYYGINLMSKNILASIWWPKSKHQFLATKIHYYTTN